MNPNDDRLGIGLMTRARAQSDAYKRYEGASYKALERQNPGIAAFGPMRSSSGARFESVLRDPQWQGFMQALSEQGVDRIADTRPGYEPTFNPQTQGTAAVQSNQLNAPSLRGLFGATRRKGR